MLPDNSHCQQQWLSDQLPNEQQHAEIMIWLSPKLGHLGVARWTFEPYGSIEALHPRDCQASDASREAKLDLRLMAKAIEGMKTVYLLLEQSGWDEQKS